MAGKQAWFKPRTAGLQWGYPSAKQGWMVYAAFILVWLIALALIIPRDVRDTVSMQELWAFSIVFVLDVLALGYFLAKYGDVPSRAGIKKRLTRRARKS